MTEMQQLPADDPIVIAFRKYRRDGVLWSAFLNGWCAAVQHEPLAVRESCADLTASNEASIGDIHRRSMRLIQRIINESLRVDPHDPESYPKILALVEKSRAAETTSTNSKKET